MVRLSALLMACFLVGSPIANAQECMDKLVAALQKVSDQCNPEKHSTCHISYRLEQQQWEGGQQAATFNLYSNNERHYLFSDDFLVVADPELTVSVQEPGKTIYIGSSLQNDVRQQSLDRIMQQQLTGLRVLEEQRCEQIDVDGKIRTRLVLVCPEEYQLAYRATRVEYEFDDAFVYRVTVHGAAGSPMKQTTYHIQTVEVDGKHAELAKAPTDFILDANGKLRAEYSAYAIEQIGNTAAITNLPTTNSQNQ